MLKLVSPVQSANASSPIEVTELGISMLVNPVQPENAPSPIAVIELGKIVLSQPKNKVLEAVSIIALQLLRESYLGFPLSTTMLVSTGQSKNAIPLISVTELGMTMPVIPMQPSNA